MKGRGQGQGRRQGQGAGENNLGVLGLLAGIMRRPWFFGWDSLVLNGTVTRVRFVNEQGDFSVFDVLLPDKTQATVSGPSVLVAQGLQVRVTGEWQDHPRYGKRFRAASVLVLPPSDLDGIVAYLKSGQIPGIGEKFAARIAAHFGSKLAWVLDNEPEKLTEVPGIGKDRAAKVAQAWHSQVEERQTMVLLLDMGLTQNQASRAVRVYGHEAPAVVAADPYVLAEHVSGFGFLTADKIAKRAGITADSMIRQQAAVRHILLQASNFGHLFLPLEELASQVAVLTEQPEQLALDAVEKMAKDGKVAVETVFEGKIVFDIHLHRAEIQVANRVRQLAGIGVRPIEVTGEAVSRLAASQRAALQSIVSSSMAVLTGGPGTGKTTVIGAILSLADQAALKTALAAPTGRAAMRMKEATGREAKTLHRLLEFNPQNGRFMRDEHNPLDADWVVIDEASMLDIGLADHLLRAISPGTRLTFVGDADQLPPVGPGDPFRSLIASEVVPVAWLTEVFRQEEGSEIVAAAHQVLKGRNIECGTDSGNRGPDELGDFYLVVREDAADLARMAEHLVAERIPARFGLDPLTDIQVLSPMRRSECGTDALNTALRQRLNPQAAKQPFPAVGDKVIQTKNNYDREVFNGDVGVVLNVSPEGTTVQFDDRIVFFEAGETDDLAPAYAITVHKSQGSEFPAVVICVHTSHYVMLRRNLLYTAITRGKKLVVVCTNQRALKIALSNYLVEPRNSMLVERLGGRGHVLKL